MMASASAFALIGQTASTQLIRKQIADVAAFVAEGGDATFARSVVLSGQASSFSLNGQGTTLHHHKKLDAQPVDFSITGQVTSLNKVTAYRLDTQAGSLTVTGAMTNAFRARKLSAQLGAYFADGAQNQLVYDRVLFGSYDSCAWQLAPAQLSLSRQLHTDFGSYALQGQASTDLVEQGFEDANPYNVRISARTRHTREVRAFCFHIPSRQRVIHEAIQ